MESKTFRISNDGKSYFGAHQVEKVEEKKEVKQIEEGKEQVEGEDGEDLVTGIDVVAAKDTGIDYDKLVDKFGCTKMTDELIKKIEKLTG